MALRETWRRQSVNYLEEVNAVRNVQTVPDAGSPERGPVRGVTQGAPALSEKDRRLVARTLRAATLQGQYTAAAAERDPEEHALRLREESDRLRLLADVIEGDL